MSWKQSIHAVTPDALKYELHKIYDRWSLMKSDLIEFDTSHLKHRAEVSLRDIFNDLAITERWNHDAGATHTHIAADGHGGVNYGDGRAIYYLVNALRSRDVLEVGTHIGVSTAHVSCALRHNEADGQRPPHLTTVDIIDVNDLEARPWVKNGSKHSPQEIIDKLGNSDLVDFVAQNSTEFLRNCERTFDFIFLDGSHAAEMVYHETALALRLLNDGGVILLHDYFPGLKPLWSNKAALPGPFLAGEKIQAECDTLLVQPLGALPWSTKLGSTTTSLALVLRR